MIKKLLAVVLLLGLLQATGFVRFWNPNLAPSLKSQGGIDPAKKAGTGMIRGTVRHIPFEKVTGKDFDLPDIATSGAFTIVDFTADTCPTCVALEPAYQRLVRARSDLNVIRIDMPTQFGFTADSAEEAARLQKELEATKERIERAMARFDFCGTPHIAILDPEKKVFRADGCRTKKGFDYVKDWLDREKISW